MNEKLTTGSSTERAAHMLGQYSDDSSGSGSETINSQDEEEEKKIDYLGDVDEMCPTKPSVGNNHYRHASSEVAHGAFLGEDNWNDPWSSDTWNDANWNTPSASKPLAPAIATHVDASFDSLQFPATPKNSVRESSDVPDPFDVAFGKSDNHADQQPCSTKAPAHTPLAATVTPTSADRTRPPPLSTEASSLGLSPSKSHQRSMSRDAKVKIVLQERLSILFDESTKDPICRVVGRIFVKSPRATRKRKIPINSFCLTIRDKRAHVEHWDENSSRCQNITAGVPHLALDPGDQVFLVSLKGEEDKLEAPIVGYTCIPRLRPMPMLLKTKVHRSSGRCRVGIRIRANPQNNYTLTDIALLLIVPLEVDGEKVTMSRKGGIWDEMKRSLVWTIQQLAPGEVVDIQAQFKCIEGVPLAPAIGELSSNFPVLARCKGTAAFSKIDVNTEYTEEGSTPVELEMQRSAMVMYRKV